MIQNKAVKSTALALLKGNWANAVFAGIAPVATAVIIFLAGSLLDLPIGTFSGIIVVIALLFILSPLNMGVLRYFWRMSNECKDSPVEIFYYFSSLSAYRRVMNFNIKITFRVILGAVIFSLPATVVATITSESFYEFIGSATPLWVLSFKTLVVILQIAGYIATVAYLISLYLPAFLMVANEDMTADECIRHGIKIGRYTKVKFANIVFSYIGWIILTILAVPCLFTMPYLLMSYVVSCRFLVARHNMLADKINGVPKHEI
ncbi:MAG: DUF975 family protein [Ruminococcaceae bacterium]|nr:DUF975 family protein [Oscillospiraceae bacterium]